MITPHAIQQPNSGGMIGLVQVDSVVGVIDFTKQYLIDGIIDMGTVEITVPSSGISVLDSFFRIEAR